MSLQQNKNFNFQQGIVLVILGCYFLPVFIYSCWSANSIHASSWLVYSTGLIISFFGTAVLLVSVQERDKIQQEDAPAHTPDALEADPPPPVQQLHMEAGEKITPLVHATDSLEQVALENTLQNSNKQQEQLMDELRNSMHYSQQLEEEKQQLQNQLNQAIQDYNEYKSSIQKRIEEEEHSSGNLQKTIVEQRATIEQKQHLVTKLENKVQDLSYEVKTLLQLGDISATTTDTAVGQKTLDNIHPVLDSFSQKPEAMDVDTIYNTQATSDDREVHSSYDASIQLQHCVQLAEELQGAAHLAKGDSRFNDLTVDSQALDLRRLADTFRSEVSAPTLLFSTREHQIVFASNQMTGLVGWSPEKIVKDYFSLLQEGKEQWDQTIQNLERLDEAQLRLVIKTKAGEDILLYCHLAPVRTGIFTGHVIALLYQPHEASAVQTV